MDNIAEDLIKSNEHQYEVEEQKKGGRVPCQTGYRLYFTWSGKSLAI